jgi:hypothetical protein
MSLIAMMGKNWQLDADDRLSLRNNWLKFKTPGETPITSEEFVEYTSNQYRRTEGCQHVTSWTCRHLSLMVDLSFFDSQPLQLGSIFVVGMIQAHKSRS